MNGNYSLQARYLPHQHQEDVTGIGGNTNEGNYCNQALSLSVLGKVELPNGQWEYLPYEWYILEAVQKHEEVHLEHYLPALKDAVQEIEAVIEQLNTEATPGKTVDQSIAEIKESTAYRIALKTSRDIWFREYIFPAAKEDHKDTTPEVEHKVVDPVKNSICNYAKTHGWTTCAACSP